MTETVLLSPKDPGSSPMPNASAARRGGALLDAGVVVAAVVCGTVLGAWTAHAQGWLPFDLAPLANSSGSWALIAFAVALLARRASVAALSGALTLGALVVGYYGVHGPLLGYPAFDSLVGFWGLVALLAGPPLGLAAHALRHGTGLRAALGLAAMPGVLIGEGVSSLLRIADSTSVTYWEGEIAAGVVLLLAGAVLRLRPLAAVAAVLVTGLVAGAFVVAYGVVPVVLGQL